MTSHGGHAGSLRSVDGGLFADGGYQAGPVIGIPIKEVKSGLRVQ